MAAQTKRPLFPITCGDIGTTASEVEQRLERYFDLAHKWGCVLLLDEADVYLATREKGGDLQRNSLVSGIPHILFSRVQSRHVSDKLQYFYESSNIILVSSY